MRTFRHLRNFWIPWITTMVLAFFGNSAAQGSYKVTDLGALGQTIWLVPCPSIMKVGW